MSENTKTFQASLGNNDKEILTNDNSKAEENSPPKTSYAHAIAMNTIHSLDPKMRQEIMIRIKEIDIEKYITSSYEKDGETKDAPNVVYLRNSDKRIFSFFKEPPQGLSSLQDVNLMLVDALTDTKVIFIQVEEYKAKIGATNYKLGNISSVVLLATELIYLLKLKSENYTSEVKKLSSLTKWVVKKALLFRRTPVSSRPDINFTPKDHQELQQLTNLSDRTVSYKLILQTISLLACHNLSLQKTTIKYILEEITSGNNPAIAIRRTMNDAGNIEPYYLWLIVLSQNEKRALIEFVGEDFFKHQRNLLDRFKKSKNAGVESVELHNLQDKIKSILPKNVFPIIYGRLKKYHELRKAGEIEKYKNLNKIKAINYGDWIKIINEKIVMNDLLCDIPLIGILNGSIKSSLDIQDMTKESFWDAQTKKWMFKAENINGCKSLFEIAKKAKSDEKPSLDILILIESRTIGTINLTGNKGIKGILDSLATAIDNIFGVEDLSKSDRQPRKKSPEPKKGKGIKKRFRTVPNPFEDNLYLTVEDFEDKDQAKLAEVYSIEEAIFQCIKTHNLGFESFESDIDSGVIQWGETNIMEIASYAKSEIDKKKTKVYLDSYISALYDRGKDNKKG